MKKRIVYIMSIVLMTAIATAFARGGWAVVTVDTLPTHFVAGRATHIAFTLRQHGHGPLSGRSPTVTLRNGRTELVARTRAGEPGRYSASVTPPRAGQWEVEVQTDFGPGKLDLVPITAINAGATPPRMSQVELGRRMFVAKGCVTCHEHKRAHGPATTVGPELTQPRFSADYMKAYVRNPSIRASTPGRMQMPAFPLKPAELDAIVAFLSQQK